MLFLFITQIISVVEAQSSQRERLRVLNLAPLPPRPKTEQTLCELYDSQSQQIPDIRIGEGTPFPTASSVIAAYGSSISGKTIGSNNTTFTIDATISFIDCTFFMSSCAKIKVNSSHWFAVYKSRFMCCEGRWEGIDVTATRAGLIMQDNRIEDANRAVMLGNYTSSGSTTITDNRFNRNRIGIQIEGSAGKARVFSFRRFYGNKFDCTSQVNPESPDCQVYAKKNLYTWGFSGILIKNISVPNLGTSGSPNIFTGVIRCGIEIISQAEFKANSNVNIENCQFKYLDCDFDDLGLGNNSINPYTTVTHMFTGAGYGILAYNASVNIKGFGVKELVTEHIPSGYDYGSTKNAMPTFENCAGGVIKAHFSDLSMHNCTSIYEDTKPSGWPSESLDHITQIVDCRFPTTTNKIEIEGNFFSFIGHDAKALTFFTAVIDVQRTSGVNNINGNVVRLSYDVANPSSCQAITVNGRGNTRGQIYYNFLNLDTPRSSSPDDCGILVNTNISTLFKNFITGKSFKNGIIISNSVGCSFINNKIQGFSEAKSIQNAAIWLRGIVFAPNPTGASNNLICNNLINNAKVGIEVMSACDNSKIASNVLKNCTTRLLLSHKNTPGQWNVFEPIIGQQAIDPGAVVVDAYQNNFMNAASLLVRDAVHQGTKPELSKFWVEDKNYINFPVLLSVASGKEWFKVDPTIVRTFPCDGVDTSVVAIANESLSALDEALVEGSYEELAPALWLMEAELMSRFDKRPSLRNTSAQRQSFYNQRLSNNMLAFANVSDKIAAADLVSQEDLMLIQSSKVLIYRKLNQLNDLIRMVENENWTTEQIAEYETLASEMENLAQGLNKQFSIVALAKQAKWLAAQTANNLLVPSSILETDIKKLNAYQIKVALGQVPSESETQEVYTIAGKCINVIGGEIERANNLLPLSLRRNLDNALNCLPQFQPTIIGKQQVGMAKVYPNPVSDVLSVVLNPKENPTKISLVNLMGQVLIEKGINDANEVLDINVQHLANGIYTLNVWSDKTLVSNTKFVIAQRP